MVNMSLTLVKTWLAPPLCKTKRVNEHAKYNNKVNTILNDSIDLPNKRNTFSVKVAKLMDIPSKKIVNFHKYAHTTQKLTRNIFSFQNPIENCLFHHDT